MLRVGERVAPHGGGHISKVIGQTSGEMPGNGRNGDDVVYIDIGKLTKWKESTDVQKHSLFWLRCS